MNRQFKEKKVADVLAQSLKGKLPYIAPQCEVIPIGQVSFVCTSIPFNKDDMSGGGPDDYDDDEEKDGGTSDINIGF